MSQVSSYNLALRSELDNVKLTIQRLEEEELRLRQEIERIEGRVEAAFDRQQELTQLTRDYENLEEYYRTLLDRKLNTRLSSKVLRTHSANQYEVLDPPRVPRHPYDPDPIRIILLGIGCGLAVGVLADRRAGNQRTTHSSVPSPGGEHAGSGAGHDPVAP